MQFPRAPLNTVPPHQQTACEPHTGAHPQAPQAPHAPNLSIQVPPGCPPTSSDLTPPPHHLLPSSSPLPISSCLSWWTGRCCQHSAPLTGLMVQCALLFLVSNSLTSSSRQSLCDLPHVKLSLLFLTSHSLPLAPSLMVDSLMLPTSKCIVQDTHNINVNLALWPRVITPI